MHPEADKIIDLYRRHALAWANIRGSRLQERTWIEKFLALQSEMPSILDVGCGSGDPIGRYLLEKRCKVTGVDTSPELIEIARKQFAEAEWLVSDMRTLRLGMKFDGLLAWHSTFHLTPDDQRRMFPIFRQHAAKGAALMFTSGPSHGDTIGEFEGEALYHSSLDGDEYHELLNQHGFTVVEHVIEDPDCGSSTIWLAKFHGEG